MKSSGKGRLHKEMGDRIFPLKDVEGLILAYLDFRDRRILNQVNWRYRRMMNAEFLALYPKRDPRRTLHQMMKRSDILACQWWCVRHPGVFNTLLLQKIVAGGPQVLAWARSMGSPPKSEYFYFACRTNFRPTMEYVADWCYNEFSTYVAEGIYPDGWTSETCSWMDQLIAFRGIIVDWAQTYRNYYQPLLGRGHVEALKWLKSKTTARIPIPLSIEVITHLSYPEVWSWGQTEHGYDYAPHYASMFIRSSQWSNARGVRWLLQQGYQVPIPTNLRVHWSLSTHQAVRELQNTPALQSYHRALLATQDWRYPPQSPELYAWLATLSVGPIRPN